MSERLNGEQFEEDVRRIARAIWSENIYNDRDFIEERERDVRIETKDKIIFIECTMDETLKKVKHDVEKLRSIITATQKSTTKIVVGLIITSKTPTQHQIQEVKSYNPIIRIMSLEKLQAEVIDGANYLSLRQKYFFGSARDLKDPNKSIQEGIFVDPIFGLVGSNESCDIDHISARLSNQGNLCLITGDYGAGKSMTCRELFMIFRRNYLRERSTTLPVYLNLRDHTGQSDPTEALHRHAKKLGYTKPDELVRAWRSGFCFLILDGFDEMATAGWALSIPKIRQHRYAGVALIRNFIKESPVNTSLIIAGKRNFFDSTKEMYHAIGVRQIFHVTVDNFNNEQLERLKNNLGVKSHLPDWLPTRPLLASYLLLHGIVREGEREWPVSAPEGWAKLLDMICEREADQVEQLDPLVVRELLDRLATIARGSRDGLGSFNLPQLHAVFTDITGIVPDENSQKFISRLPGLQADADLEDGTRRFIDLDYISALRSGDVIRLIEAPYKPNDDNLIMAFLEANSDVRNLTVQILSNYLIIKNKSSKQISAIMSSLNKLDVKSACNEIILACYSIDIGFEVSVYVSNAEIDELGIERTDSDFSNVIIHETIVHALHVDTEGDATKTPKLNDCIFARITGARNQSELSRYSTSCEAVDFAEHGMTPDAILHSHLPQNVSVLLASLKKLYLQAGSGRKASAFYRGIDPKMRSDVDLSLELMGKHGFATRSKYRGSEMYFPNRKLSDRVRRVMSDPFGSGDAIIDEVKDRES